MNFDVTFVLRYEERENIYFPNVTEIIRKIDILACGMESVTLLTTCLEF